MVAGQLTRKPFEVQAEVLEEERAALRPLVPAILEELVSV